MNVQKDAAKPTSLFGNKFYRTILLSNILLQIGIWVRNFAILLFVVDKTGGEDSVAVSMIYVAEFAPIFIFSFIGGTFADRWKPKRTMIWCDFLSAVSVFLVLLALMFGSWQAIFFVTLVSAVLSQFSQPSGMRLFKQHLPADQMQQAMAFFQSLMAIFLVSGPFLGTFVFSQFGIEVSIAVMGVAFLLSAAVLLRLPADREVKSEAYTEKRFWSEFKEGFRYVWHSRVLRMLGVTFALAGLAVGISQALNIFIVTEQLSQPKEFLTYMLSVNGIAMLIGGGLIGVAAKKFPPQKLLAYGMAVGAATTIVIGFSTSVPLTLGASFLGGLSYPAIHIGIMTMIMQWSEESIVGRVNGVLNPMFLGMMVLMIMGAGIMKQAVSLPVIYTVSAVLMALGALVLVPVFGQKAPIREPAAGGA
ncbi:MFS transporter [Paenibacillus tarimensis]